MFLSLLQFFATKFLVLALHLESGSFPRPLSAQEEAEAFAALRAGDPAAREKLIRHNLRLVAHIVKKYYALPGDQDDLVSIGTIGLMKAVDTFDSARRTRFSTYASRCIENAILSQLLHGGGLRKAGRDPPGQTASGRPARPGTADHPAAVWPCRPAAADPAGGGRASEHQPELCLPP